MVVVVVVEWGVGKRRGCVPGEESSVAGRGGADERGKRGQAIGGVPGTACEWRETGGSVELR